MKVDEKKYFNCLKVLTETLHMNNIDSDVAISAFSYMICSGFSKSSKENFIKYLKVMEETYDQMRISQ